MKILILIRHAKSSWSDPSLQDRDRPLNTRGKRDAPWIGAQLKKHGLIPRLIMSSPAVRALKTARKLARELDYGKQDIQIREEIYAQGRDGLRALVAGCPEDANPVALVGHNPVLTEFANDCSDATLDNIPTAGIVVIEFPSETWAATATQRGRLALFERPPKSPDEA